MTPDQLLEYFVEVEGFNGLFLLNGKWYAPKYGVDTLVMIINKIDEEKNLTK